MIGGMLQLLNAAAHGAGHSARALLFRCQLALLAYLIGVTGAGFLLFWGFDTLSTAFGTRMAAFLLGSALIIVAAGILLFVYRTTLGAPAPKRTEQPSTPSSKPTPADTSSIVAFTLAFVLGRHLTERDRK